MAGNTVSLRFEVDNRQALRELGRVQGKLDDVDRTATRSGGRTSKFLGVGVAAGAAAGAAAVGGFALAVRNGFQELSEAQKVTAQTNAVLKSTGGVAGVTAREVERLAGAISRKTGIDDEQIQASENLLLTFKDIRNEVDKNNDIFDQATGIAADLSVALGTDLNSASIQVGKALNDPVRGVTALRRVGISFNDAQTETIEKLVETGDKAAAQRLILEELRSEVGNSAAAYGDTLPGKLAKARNSFDELTGQLAGFLLPAAEEALDGVSGLVDELGRADGFRAKVGVVVEGLGGIAGQIRDAIVGTTTTRQRYSVQLHRMVTFKKNDPGLADDLAKAIQTAIEGPTVTRRRYNVETHRFIQFDDQMPGLGERLQESFADQFAGIDWGDVFGGGVDVNNKAADLQRTFGKGLAIALFDAFEEEAARASDNTTIWDQTVAAAERGVGALQAAFVTFPAWVGTEFGQLVSDATRDALTFGEGVGAWAGDQFKRVGDAAGEGLKDGFRATFDWFGNIGPFLQRSMIDPFKQVLGIGSPSTLFRGFGEDIVNGLIGGVRDLPDRVFGVFDRARDRAVDVMGDFRQSVGRLADRARETVVDSLGALPGALGRVWDRVSLSASNAWQAIVRTIKTWVGRAIDPVNDVLGFLNLPPIPAPHINAGDQPVGPVGERRGGLAHGGVVKPRPGGEKMTLAGHRVVVGEASREEVVMTTDRRHRERTLRLVDYVLGKIGTKAGRNLDRDLLPDRDLPRLAAGGVLQRALAEAQRIDRLDLRYQWGGGHVTPAPANGPFDCSSFVSRVLQASGLRIPTMTSGQFMSVGRPGRGALEVLANQGHVYMGIGGQFYGTSTGNPGGGPGRLPYGERSGFAVRSLVEPGGVVNAIQGFLGGLVEAINPADILRDRLPGIPEIAGPVGEMARGALRYASDQLIEWAESKATSVFTGGGGGSSANIRLGEQMAARMGWKGPMWNALRELWMRESGWNEHADNPDSTAYGIPQALPGNKMATAGRDWHDDPATQIRWGLGYVRGRYGNPMAALQHHDQFNWYASGTRNARPGWAVVGEDGPEVVQFKGGEKVFAGLKKNRAEDDKWVRVMLGENRRYTQLWAISQKRRAEDELAVRFRGLRAFVHTDFLFRQPHGRREQRGQANRLREAWRPFGDYLRALGEWRGRRQEFRDTRDPRFSMVDGQLVRTTFGGFAPGRRPDAPQVRFQGRRITVDPRRLRLLGDDGGHLRHGEVRVRQGDNTFAIQRDALGAGGGAHRGSDRSDRRQVHIHGGINISVGDRRDIEKAKRHFGRGLSRELRFAGVV